MFQKTTISLALSVLIGGSISAVSAHSFYTHVDTPAVKASQLAEQQVPRQLVSESQFVFRPVKRPFDIQSFFEQHAPQWAFLSESLTHWAGITSVDPRIIITTLAVTENWPDTEAPGLAKKALFKEKVSHLTNHLSQYFYSYRSGDYELSSYSPSTLALMNELASYSDWKKWQKQYQDWFGTVDPSSLLSTQSLRASSKLPESGFLQMPWRRGYNWVPNGPHSYTGSGYPLSSFDVSYDWPQWGATTYDVAAANAGTVSVLSSCEVRVTNENGWATNYYHMDGIQVTNGQYVKQNTVLGYYAGNKSQALCSGGSSTGPHLHFSVLYNGVYNSIDGISFGPYQVHVGRYSYDDNCSYAYMTDTRSNKKVCFWNRIDNPVNY
ncbi:Protease LasA precursor [Vibrio aerogenes CECT 7868]|uniref:Protease LasA n=1 Tax=Vibrio aerogenes CECT 7868 TaxID=1216006 RepID=A0A1M5VAK0_9VIBR|nr:M23 family metallopeptidase [Vibrio aerogenes]SHH72312.1 Protease LasA precursor [Vibrio aerogenes CECT 7868]